MGLNEKKGATAPLQAEAVGAESGTGPLPKNPAENDFRETNWFQPDPSHEEETRKHKVWNLEEFENPDASPDWQQSDSNNSTEPPTLKNESPVVDATEIATGSLEASRDTDDSREDGSNNEDIDILSILDLQLDAEEIVPDQPRQLSKDQLTPTDWISELVPQDDELPTMADMLPQPTPVDPGTEIETPSENQSNVMDMLFGDSDILDEDEKMNPETVSGLKPNLEAVESDSAENELFESMEVAEPLDPSDLPSVDPSVNEFEELTMDSWLTDVMSDMEDEPVAEEVESVAVEVEEPSDQVEELPDWLDFSDTAEQPSIDQPVAQLDADLSSEKDDVSLEAEQVIPEEPLSSEVASVDVDAANKNEEPIESNISESSIEEQDLFIVEEDEIEDGVGNEISQGFNFDSWEDDVEEDSLNWLTDDIEEDVVADNEEAVASEPMQEDVPEATNQLQTRNLSEVELPFDLAEMVDNAPEGNAVQAELPNWIKEMAPDASNESVIVPDEDNFQMNDDALSEIIASMESELNLDQEGSEESIAENEKVVDEAAFLDEADDQSQILETMVGKHTQPLSQFDKSAPDLNKDSYIQSDPEEPSLDLFDGVAEEDDEIPEMSLPSEEDLLKDAISAIESEIDELKEESFTPSINLTDDGDLPDWLPSDEDDQFSNTSLPMTRDLPDWLQQPQVEDPADPASLGFKEANVEDVQSIPAEEMEPGPADEIDDIIAQHMTENLDPIEAEVDVPDDVNQITSEAPIADALDGDLSQFAWDDIENVEGEELFRFDQSDNIAESSLFESYDEPATPAAIEEHEAVSDVDDVNQPMAVPDSTVDEAILTDEVESGSFDWLDGEALDDPSLVETSEELSVAADENDSIFGADIASDTDEVDEVESGSFDWLDGEALDEPSLLETSEDLSVAADANDSIFGAELTSDTDEEDAADSGDFDWLDGESADEFAFEPEAEASLEDFSGSDMLDDVLSADAFSPEMDILEEPEIAIPDLKIESELPSVDPVLEPADSIEDSIFSIDDSDDEIDMSAWDEMEEAFSPLVEFEDETDVFSSIRDTPRVEETISAESLAGYISKPDLEIDAQSEVAAEQEPVDDFLSSFSDADDEAELPSWASELTSTSSTDEGKTKGEVSGRNPLFGIDNIVDIAPVVANPVQDLTNLHAPQMMEPVAHRKRAHLAAQAAGTVPMSDPTQPVVVPKARQRYQPRFNPTQFDGRPAQEKKKRRRQVGILVVATVIALMVGIAFSIPYIISLFSG